MHQQTPNLLVDYNWDEDMQDILLPTCLALSLLHPSGAALDLHTSA